MRWFLLPGMGATDAMYNGLKHRLGFKVNFLNWPEYHGEKTYADVARRVIKENDIGADDVVGGSSLGAWLLLRSRQDSWDHIRVETGQPLRYHHNEENTNR